MNNKPVVKLISKPDNMLPRFEALTTQKSCQGFFALGSASLGCEDADGRGRSVYRKKFVTSQTSAKAAGG